MTDEQRDDHELGDITGVPINRLTKSYRFDEELAALLTEFQYQQDGIQLTAAASRPLPQDAYAATTPGLAAVLDTDASLVVITYDERGHQMVNPIETTIITAIATALTNHSSAAQPPANHQPSPATPLGEPPTSTTATPPQKQDRDDGHPTVSMGVVTPHNAQRGALTTALPDAVTANTVEKYQGDERDVIAVSGTVSDPEFARREDRFILDPRRLLVAISRARLLTIVVCSRALFEVTPEDSDRLDNGPVWARLFTLTTGDTREPAWRGPLDEFTPRTPSEHPDLPITVYTSDR